MFVKPASGFTVRDPVHKRALPETGATVPDTAYWSRRLRDGDVVEADPPAAPAPATPGQE